MVSRYAYHGPNSWSQGCRFCAEYLLGALCTQCTGRSAYRSSALGVFREASGKEWGRGVLHLDWIVWGYGRIERDMSVWGQEVSAGKLEGVEDHLRGDYNQHEVL